MKECWPTVNLLQKIRAAAQARISRHETKTLPSKSLSFTPMISSEKLIAVGASTGARRPFVIFRPLPITSRAVLIIPTYAAGFTHSFAERLNRLCQISVKEAERWRTGFTGHAYIAPGDYHMELRRNGANYRSI